LSIRIKLEKIEINSNIKKIVEEPVAYEAPVNIFVNSDYVVTLLTTPQLIKELAIGWLFTEGVLQSIQEIKQVVVDLDSVNILTKKPIDEHKLQVSGVSRLITTACGLTTEKFLKIISGISEKIVESEYKIQAETIPKMVNQLDKAKLFQSTGGVHVAALFEKEALVAFAEDVGRHNAVDKVVGIGIQKKSDFSHSVIVSSGRQPADMVLKVARVEIPIIVSRAAPIRSGIIAAQKTGLTLICFARENRINIYTNSHRILMKKR
jgi:FdhD protein